MGDFVGYDGASVFSPHPKTVIEDGYVSVGPDGSTIVAYSSSTQPNGALTSLPPNSLLASPGGIVITSGGLITLTLKQYFPRLMFASAVTEQSNATTPAVLQLMSDTVGQASATNTALPTVVFQCMVSGSGHALAADSGFRFLLILQNASVY